MEGADGGRDAASAEDDPEHRLKEDRLSRGTVYELLASEYGWTYREIREMTYWQISLTLDRLLARKTREAGPRPDEGADDDDGPEVLRSRGDFDSFFGQ
jgi:hypothetical protein